MKIIETNIHDDTKTNAMPKVADRLPDLGPRQLAVAKSRADWATWFWGAEQGYIYTDESTGVTWQIVEEGKVRCIRIWDDDYCYENLAMMRATMQLVDLEVEIDPYTVVTPYVEPAKEEPLEEVAGMEVA